MKKKHFIIFILVLWHIFIFSNSLMPAEVSSSQSNAVVDAVKPVVDVLAPNLAHETLSHLVRKSAHIFQFMVLGLLLYATYKDNFKKYILILVISSHGLITAICDEFIQYFVPGRGAQVTDVLIDMLGLLIGISLAFLIQYIFNKYRYSDEELIM